MILWIIGSLIVFIVSFIISKKDLQPLIIIIFLGWSILSIGVADYNYKQGQIDAMNNKWDYERQISKTEKTGISKTNYVMIEEK
jgi:hypothetical protein